MVLAGLTGLMVLGATFTSFAGEWIYDGPADWQWWYQNDDGGYTKNDWQQIDGKWYHFDENGYLDIRMWLKEDGTITEKNWLGEEYSYTVEKWYWLSDTGEMATSGSWEGGHIGSDGVLVIDGVGVVDGELLYWNGETRYSGTLEWKTLLAKEWESAIGGRDDVGVYTLDFQLPSNWAEQCPKPLMSALIDYTCAGSWAGETSNWTHSWSVDESYIIHITAEFKGY